DVCSSDLEACSVDERLPVTVGDMGELIVTADLHRELQLPYIVVGKRACDVVERREADLSARVKQRIVLGVRIRAADEVVEGERIEERRAVLRGLRGFVDQ